MDYCGPRGIPHSEFLSWPIDDQVKALGWQAEQNAACSQCGTRDWEWEQDRRAYRAEAYVCMGCLALGSAQKEHEKTAKTTPGLHIRLVKNGVGDGASH